MKKYNPNDFRYILKGCDVYIDKGKELTKHISMPDGYFFHENLLFQIGMLEVPVSEAEVLAKEFKC